MTEPAPETIEAGRAALRAGDPAEARAAFTAAAGDGEPGADALEGLARAAYLDLDFDGAIRLWERAYAAYRAAGETLPAIRVARTLSGVIATVRGDWAVCQGWIARCETMLRDAPASSERGWVALNAGMFEPDRTRKEQQFERALTVAREVGDVELEMTALAYLGASRVHGDRVADGMAMLDESLAAVAGNEVDDCSIVEEIFCQLFSACEHAHDVTRADQWIRVGDTLAHRRRLPSVAAFCHTHYGGVLTAAGRWSEADDALTEAIRLWALGRRGGLRAGAVVRLADLRVRQGRYEEAAQLLAEVDVDADVEAARPYAALQLATGNASIAADVVERALSRMEPTSSAAAPLWALLVDVHLARDRADDAASATAALITCAEMHPTPYLRAMAALASGRLCLARGDGDPLQCLREALAGFAGAQMPAELAQARLELAAAVSRDRPEVAIAEAQSALQTFERLRAARDADAAAALLRSLGAKPGSPRSTPDVLTKREADVLELLGSGLSNPEIAARLFISRKTVEHHVGNILAKLGLRSRAEAAVYATRARSGAK